MKPAVKNPKRQFPPNVGTPPGSVLAGLDITGMHLWAEIERGVRKHCRSTAL